MALTIERDVDLDLPRDRRRAFAEALVAARTARGLSQMALAKRVGATQPNISAWEVGRHAPDADTVFGLEVALELAPGYLSRHLGFLPLGAPADPAPCTFERAVAEDPFLSEVERDVFLRQYAGVVGRHRPPS